MTTHAEIKAMVMKLQKTAENASWPAHQRTLSGAAILMMRMERQRDGLTEALDKLLALYRKETGLHDIENPVTLECDNVLKEVRRVE